MVGRLHAKEQSRIPKIRTWQNQSRMATAQRYPGDVGPYGRPAQDCSLKGIPEITP